MGVDSIIDKYTEYASVYSAVTNKYINMYGKDATYLFLNQTENGDNSYVTALGKNNVSLDYSSPDIKKVPVHILVDQADWYKSYMGETTEITLYFTDEVQDPVTAGDMLLYQKGDKQFFYRISEPSETYSKIIYRCNIKLVQSKEASKPKPKNGLIC